MTEDAARKSLKAAPLIHKWFARRMAPAVATVWERIAENVPATDLVVDPFCGGGSLPLFAAVSGFEALCGDINPVAALISAATLAPPSPEEFLNEAARLTDLANDALTTYYPKEWRDGEEFVPVTHFYVRILTCICGARIAGHHDAHLAGRPDEDGWYVCLNCEWISQGPAADCAACGSSIARQTAPVGRGRVHCNSCGKSSTVAELAKNEAKPVLRLFALELVGKQSHARLFRQPTKAEHDAVTRAASAAEATEIYRVLEQVPIPVAGRKDKRPVSHGYRNYADLFFPRQLLGFQALADGARWERYPEALARSLLLVFSDVAGSNSKMCTYAGGWYKLTPTFGMHAFRPPTRPVEGHFTGAPLGRGSLRSVAAKAARAYRTILSSNPANAAAYCCSATALSDLVGNRSFIVYTDPPYFDFLEYADLSDFYYQIQKAVRPGYFPAERSHAHSEADISLLATRSGGSGQTFGDALGESLRSFVTKPGFRLGALHFHHNSREAWDGLQRALETARASVAHVSFVESEYDNGFHSSAGNAKIDAIFFIVSVGTATTSNKFPPLTDELVRALSARIGKPSIAADTNVVSGALSVWQASRRGRSREQVERRIRTYVTRRFLSPKPVGCARDLERRQRSNDPALG